MLEGWLESIRAKPEHSVWWAEPWGAQRGRGLAVHGLIGAIQPLGKRPFVSKPFFVFSLLL